jgi:RNase P/RNase MRP subunit p29
MNRQKPIYVAYPRGDESVLWNVPLTPSADMCLLSDMNELHTALKEMGLRDFAVKDLSVKIGMKYCVVDFTKNAFVDSSDSYGHDTVPMKDFLHEVRGLAASKKFGLDTKSKHPLVGSVRLVTDPYDYNSETWT